MLVTSRRPRHIKKAGAKWSAGVYKDATVKVTVTYQNLKKLITKGEKAITVNGLIDSPSFTYKSYGDLKVNFAMVQTQNFKAKLYGASNLTIQEWLRRPTALQAVWRPHYRFTEH